MNKCDTINLSIIIPIYNVEKYLPTCIDSLMLQDGLHFEIILVDDGSTDSSGTIANKYAENDNRIKVIHQENKGASVARNVGLDIAQGVYVAFFDSDDWVVENSLLLLYHDAIKYHADVVVGNIWLYNQDGSIDEPFYAFDELLNNVVSGKESFIWLIRTYSYLPMPYKYICRRKYLQETHARFEEGIMHEDELWCPIILCQASKVIISNIKFYYYRQNPESVMYTTNLFRRLDSLFTVTDCLMKFITQFDFSEEEKDFKSWWYVNVFKLYSITFNLLSKVQDSSYIVPKHHLDFFLKNCDTMAQEPLQRCSHYYHSARVGLQKYMSWHMTNMVTAIDYRANIKKKLVLIYNTINGEDLLLKIKDIPETWAITIDRFFFQQADLVIFHLPSLYRELENDLEKPNGQIWISWYLESEKNHPLISDIELLEIFDIWINYQEKEWEQHPLVSLFKNKDIQRVLRTL